MLRPSVALQPPHRAEPFLASLVACGLIGRAEALAAFLCAGAPPTLSRCVLRPCAVQLRADILRGRSLAALAARQALVPLLTTRAPSRILLAVAVAAAGPALQRREVESLVTDIVARYLRDARLRNNAVRHAGASACATRPIQSLTLPGAAA
jgi:hypothetical protein